MPPIMLIEGCVCIHKGHTIYNSHPYDWKKKQKNQKLVWDIGSLRQTS